MKPSPPPPFCSNCTFRSGGIPSRLPCYVFYICPLTNKNPNANKLSWAINYIHPHQIHLFFNQACSSSSVSSRSSSSSVFSAVLAWKTCTIVLSYSFVFYTHQVCIVPVQLIHTTRQLTSVSIELPTRGFSWKETRIQRNGISSSQSFFHF